MEFYEVDADIDAPPPTVWDVLTDGSGYTSWSSGVERLEGSIAAGNRIKVFSEVSPGRAFPVTVSLDADTHTMTWTGGMPLGLFKGVRTFSVSPRDGGSHFRMREEFTGPMLKLIWRSMPDLGPSFRTFADGLKVEAESKP